MQILSELLLWLFEPLRWLFWIYLIFRLSLLNIARKYEKMSSKTIKQLKNAVLG